MTKKRTCAREAPRIAVFGFYGNENLGDEAITEAVLDNVRSMIPTAEMRCISVNPVDSENRHGVGADSIFLPAKNYRSVRDRMDEQKGVPADDIKRAAGRAPISIRNRLKKLSIVSAIITRLRSALKLPSEVVRHLRFMRYIRSVIARTDTLLISGSNQFLDNFGGAKGFPLTLWLWTFFAKRANTRLAVMSVGAGPVFSPLSMRLIKGTIKRLDYLSFRDTGSVAVMGLDPATTNVLPDLAFSYRSETVKTALSRGFSLNGAPVVAINPMAVHARGYWYEVNDEKYEGYVGKLSRLVQHLEGAENEFIFISNQPRDDLVIRDVISAAVDSGSSRTELESRFVPSTTVEEYLQTASKADIVIATRFHANVLALLLARPVIGLCYHKKSAELLREFSLGDHAFDMDDFRVEDVTNSISLLTDTYEVQASGIAIRARDYRLRLDSQYEEVKRIIATCTRHS